MQQSKVILLLVLALLSVGVYSKNKEQWMSRTVYQIITDRFALADGSTPPCDIPANTYCGGNFGGLKNNLDYIKGMGFDAIWISPIPKSYPDKYYGYAAMDIYQVNEHFGGEEGLVDVLKAMRDRDMWLMLDVVANHMGNQNEDYSQNVPFNSPDDYHPWCVISDDCFAAHDMPCIQNCRLAELADINQENEKVANTLYEWIHDLVIKYEIEGLRIDTVPEVPSWFWTKFTDSAGCYTVGEVFDGDMGYCAQYIGPLSSVLNYPYFFTWRDIWIQQKSMYEIRSFYQNWQDHVSYEDLKYMGLFTDNHDNPRFLSNEVCVDHNGRSFDDCVKLYKSLTTATLTTVGIPIIYYGSEQYFNGGQDPWDREPMWNSFDTSSEMYQYMKTLNAFRSTYNPYSHEQTEAYVADNFYAFFRGQALVALTNNIFDQVQYQVTYIPFSEGEVVCNIFNPTTDCQTVSNGVNVTLIGGEAKVYVPQSNMDRFLAKRYDIVLE